ncbi:matrixin family metalloprotease [Nocardioides solisilvae]|uniref:matrixin family metalloprotease n=1 Tax=Nocardioides solisilvae TaxID=1542435 RepID=UPI000D74B7C7|nr:matrixin family metalloprotease [Nocardioides solisilvae]
MRHVLTSFALMVGLLAPATVAGSAASAERAPVPSTSATGGGAASADRPVAARPKKKRKNRTKVRATWSASSVQIGGLAAVTGKVKDKGRLKRKVVLQMKHADGWKKVQSTKTNKKGEFALQVPSDWLYSMKSRVLTKKKKRSPGAKSKTQRFQVVPDFVPAGSPDSWSYLNPANRLRWNPCQTISYRVNVAQAPAGTEEAIHRAFGAMSGASGLRFKFKGYTEAIYRGRPGTGKWERDTDLVVSWALPEQTTLDFSGAHAWGGVQDAVWGRDRKGRLGKITKGGTTFDATTPGGWPYMKAYDVLLHELGHVVGLGHVDDPTQIMATGVEGPYIYGAGDLTGMRTIGKQKGCVKTIRRRGADMISPADAGLLVALP